jgi:hypothetical protein
MNTPAVSPIQDQPHAPSGGHIIVAQVKCDRILYFTNDLDFVPVMEGDWYFVSHYLGELPPDMTLQNCWQWRFRGSVFIDERKPRPKSGPQRLIDYNRDALLKLLRDKINDARAPLLANGSMGDELRKQKLVQAKQYLTAPDSSDELALLGAVASARDMSLEEAARLIVSRAEQTARMLCETELVREELRKQIRAAKTEEELLQLRHALMNDVYPALSAKYKFAVPNTTPIDVKRELEPAHRVHEAARLKAKLRERINEARIKLHDGYQLNDFLTMRRVALARNYLREGTLPADAHDAALLQMTASSYGLTLDAAVQRVIAEATAAEKLLFDTERDKLAMLERIEKVATLRDVRNVAAAIRALSWDNVSDRDPD